MYHRQIAILLFRYHYFIYLQQISVRNNVIHDMSIDALHGLKRLKRLHIERCRLRRMPAMGHVKDTLQSLMITENSITHIPDGYFDGFLQLTRLDLAKNCLTQVPDVSPVHQTLITLSVLSNYISEIPHFMGDNILISLKSLILSNNNIQAFPPSLLSKFPNLQEFFISINNLHTLDESVFGGIHAVVLVRLSGNPWICDSALAWLCDLKLKNYSFMGFAKQFKSYGHIGITDYERLVCAGPDRYEGMDIFHLSRF